MAGPFKFEAKAETLSIEKPVRVTRRGGKDSLVGWWKFDEDSGTVAHDSAGKNNGTIHGAAWTKGKIGGALSFDGGGDYVVFDTASGLTVEQTKMLWIYMDSSRLKHDVYLIDEGQAGSGNNNWIELIDSSGNGIPEVRTGFDTWNHTDSKGEIKEGNWYHIAVVSKVSGDVSIYINGVLDKAVSGLSATNQPKGIAVGADSDTKTACFNGKIDDVRIYNYALSAKEVARVYAGEDLAQRSNWMPVLVILAVVVVVAIATRRKKETT